MNGQSTPIALQRFGPTTTGVDPTVRTWVLVHGRNGTGHTTGLTNIANTILQQFPQDQVLTLDWSQAAASPTYFDTEQWIPSVGQSAAQLLITHGFAGTTLNFIGYSFGTYVSGEAAKVLPGRRQYDGPDRPAGGRARRLRRIPEPRLPRRIQLLLGLPRHRRLGRAEPLGQLGHPTGSPTRRSTSPTPRTARSSPCSRT